MTPDLKQALDALRECRDLLSGLSNLCSQECPDAIEGEAFWKISRTIQFADYIIAKNQREREAA